MTENRMPIEATVVLLDSSGREVSERIPTALWATLSDGSGSMTFRTDDGQVVSFGNAELDLPAYWARVVWSGGSQTVPIETVRLVPIQTVQRPTRRRWRWLRCS